MPTPPADLRIWLSGAILPDEDASAEERSRIEHFIDALAREVFSRGQRLIHGSQKKIRDPLLTAAAEYKRKVNEKAGLVLGVSRWYSREPTVYGVDLKAWNQLCAEPTIVTRVVIGQDGQENHDESIALLRQTLLEQSNAFIGIGGRWWKEAVHRAGVPQEIRLAADAGLPLFLLGGLGGATCDYLDTTFGQEMLSRCRNGLSKERNDELARIKDPAALARLVLDQLALLPVRHPNPNAGRPFRILCLDGGGIRGAYSAAALAYWEKDAPGSIVHHFDLIAGTSTGGLLAIGLGLGLTASDLLTFYREEGPKIFPSDTALDAGWHAFRHWFTTKFDSAVLREKLQVAFAGAPQGSKSLDGSLCRLVIPSYNAAADRLHIWRTPHGSFSATNRDQDPVEAALATAAAPTYFDPVRTPGVVASIEAIDGGVWANHPGLVAITEAVRYLRIPIERIEMLSIGTTYSPEIKGQPSSIDLQMVAKVVSLGTGWRAALLAGLIPGDRRIRGKIGWAARIAEFLMKTQAQTADYICGGLLGERYLRIDDPSPVIDLDDVKAIHALEGLGEAAGASHKDEVRSRFLNGVPADAWN